MELSVNYTSPFVIITALCGVIFLITSFFVHKNPPKGINDLYGYRTNRSKKNEEAWNFAQGYSLRLMTMWGAILTIVGILGSFFPMKELIGVGVSMFAIFFSCGHILYKTERALKQREKQQQA